MYCVCIIVCGQFINNKFIFVVALMIQLPTNNVESSIMSVVSFM